MGHNPKGIVTRVGMRVVVGVFYDYEEKKDRKVKDRGREGPTTIVIIL